jgi:hypothetical protein
LKTNQTKYIYLKLVRKREGIVSLEKTPELLTTLALEKLILAEDPVTWKPPKVELTLSSIAEVTDFDIRPD